MRGRAVVRGKPKPTAATRDRLFEPNHGVRVRLNASLALRVHVPNLGLAPQVTGLGGLQEEREGFGQINGHAWEQCGEGYRALDFYKLTVWVVVTGRSLVSGRIHTLAHLVHATEHMPRLGMSLVNSRLEHHDGAIDLFLLRLR